MRSCGFKSHLPHGLFREIERVFFCYLIIIFAFAYVDAGRGTDQEGASDAKKQG